VAAEFDSHLERVIESLNQQGLDVALYWKNANPEKCIHIVPISAITGEGIPDVLQVVTNLLQVPTF